MNSLGLSWRLVASLSIALSLFSHARDTSAQTFVDPNFTSEVVATVAPFTLVGLAWAPDGRLFVWQKNGVVRVIKNGVLLPTPFIDLSAKVNTFDDRGFWGLAFHPNFATNGFVYMTYTFENAGNPNDASPRTSRLVRVNADPANPDVALAGSETVILGSVGTPPCDAQPAGSDCIPYDAGGHGLGSIRFAPDGKMYVGNGDGGDVVNADSRSMGAQSLDSYRGKILRLNDDGTAPTDNPFYDGTNSIRSKVWLYGVRNPYRFSLHPTRNEIYFGDVGWNNWEEINRGLPGQNHGWPCYEGTGLQPDYQSAFLQCRELAASSVTPPLYVYDHGFGSAAVGGPFYTGNLYPVQYRGSFFFTDYVGNWIQLVTFDANGLPTGVQPFATNLAAPVSIELGPDGMMYYLSFTTGQIRRIRYNGAVAAASATPNFGYSPLDVTFSSAGSFDPGGGALTYLWDFGDGTTSTQPDPNHTYTSATPRTFVARLTVTNVVNASSSATVNITVGSTPPVPTISAPANATNVMPGQIVTFQGSATDPDEGALPPGALSWTVLLRHNTHVHNFVGGTGAQGSFVVENHGTIGTYAYEIILTATDSTGLQASTSVQLPVIADTVPPDAPTNLAGVPVNASQINLSWTAATDNASVSRYLIERCQSVGCSNFVQIGTSTTLAFGDSGLIPTTTYSYRVRATDATGNLGAYSNTAPVTTNSVPPVTGLVAAYAFNEGAGTTVADASGSGNNGAITGATWVPGRFGSALRFNGSNNVVQVPSAASLNLGSAMTLEAWIQPTVAQSGWRAILQRQRDAYFLNASNDGGALLPSGGGTFGSSLAYVSGSTANPIGVWTHVALTYDGTTLKLYVNGVLANSAARTGTIQTTTNPLSIGNNTYGENFLGLIDEIRIYNRALAQAEIQTDMATPVGPAGPDTTAPSAPSGLAATAAGGTQINLTWAASSDNVGVTGYRVERCTDAGCSTFAQVGTPTGTTFSDTGLAVATSYSYRVLATDAAGNLSTYSNTATATTTAPDTTPPSTPAGLTATAVGTTQINLAWTASTDNVGVTGYRVERCAGAGCTTFAQVGAPTATTFSESGLTASTSYSYRVRATDAAGNLSEYSSTASATTATPDTTPPTAPTGLTATATSSAQINLAWTAATDDVAVTGYRLERCAGAGCSNFAQIATPTGATFNNTGLAPATPYSYRVRAVDAAGNLGAYSNAATATTSSAPDTSAPTAPGGLAGSAAGMTQINLTWTASTDNVGVNEYRIERCQGSGCNSFAQIATSTTTTFSSTGLTAGTTYRFRVRAADAAGNLSGYSNIATVATQAPDTTKPSAPSGLTATVLGANQINLSWTASTDNVGVTGYRVERCQGSGCTTWAEVGTPASTTFSSTGLSPTTVYRHRVRANDAAGNLGNYSSIVTSTTTAVPDTTPPSAPSGLTATPAGTTQVSLAWAASTDNVAVTGYRVERCAGADCSNFAQVAAPTAATFNDTGLTPSTSYSYRVRAADAAGNLSAYSGTATATTLTPDLSPPTAPTGLTATATSSTQINLAWVASTDNIGVTGYRVERCAGAGCSNFAQVATPTAASFSDTTVFGSTSYTYRVRAADAAGNLSAYSASASATTPAPPPSTGLVLALGFNEGSGTTVADASGKGNTGTINGATWAAGRFGTALSFNGVNSIVQVASSASLNLSAAMTLEAWIQPTVSQSGWRTIMQRQTDAYFLNASNGSGSLLPSGGGTFGSTLAYVAGPTASPVGSWTHVALTYDGSTLRLYVNAVLVRSAARTNTIQTSTNPLWIGGNVPYGEYFNGLIDEVRVYNRALSIGEIQTDMNTPIQ